MKISRVDRLLAIKRHPEFIKDREQYERIKQTGNTDHICGMEYYIEHKWGEPLARIEYAEEHRRLKREGKSPLSSISVVTHIEEEPIVSFKSWEGESVKRRWNTGSHLYLKVDLNFSRETLKKDFLKIVDSYQSRSRDLSREGKTTIDPFEVYDLHIYHKKNFLQITKERMGITESTIANERKKNPKYRPSPAYDVEVRNIYKQVKRAYIKANKIIEMVGPLDV